MERTKELWATTPCGKEIYLYTLKNASGAYVQLSSVGAGIVSVVVPDKDGVLADVALGYPEAASYFGDGPCAGKVPGRFANRVALGKFTLNGVEYTLPVNNGPNHLHGGPEGFQNKVWESREHEGGVEFLYYSEDGEMGYPGALKAVARYEWTEENELRLTLTAESDAPTILNLTNLSSWDEVQDMKGRRAQKLPFTQKEEVSQGAFVQGDRMIVRYKEEECDMFLQELALGGRHNVYNSMAAAIAAKVMDIDNQAIREGLATFEAVEHRLEKVLSIRDVLYINDSKATNVDSAWYALECQTRPVVWIVGGTDKGNDYSSLIPLAKEKVKAMICMGLDNAKFHESFEGVVPQIHDVTSAQDAVNLANEIAASGDVVLLSPCCASFDLFKNYEDRGRQFKEAVRRL